MSSAIARRPRLVIFDMDGVIYRGPTPVPGAAELVTALHAAGIAVRFATNNSMATREQYVVRLAELGIPSARDEIVTSTSATIEHLRRHLPEVRRLLVVGAAGMLAELTAAGFEATPAADAAGDGWDGGALPASYDAVVAGLDPQIDYRRLGIAASAIRSGARFLATNADARYPTPSGFVPGAGAIVAALRVASGSDPLIIGKPEPQMFTTILEEAGIDPADALAVGDNPDSDLPAARRAGVRSVLVLTGIADRAAASRLEGDRAPDAVADGPREIAALLGLSLS